MGDTGRRQKYSACPLRSRKQTNNGHRGTSALCQKQTFALRWETRGHPERLVKSRATTRSMAIGSKARDGALIPFEAKARTLRRNCSFDRSMGLGENGAGYIEILKPMRGRRDS
jgi:hypothetical protein